MKNRNNNTEESAKPRFSHVFSGIGNAIRRAFTEKDAHGTPVFLNSVAFYLALSFVIEFFCEILCRRSFTEAVKFMVLSPYAFIACMLILFFFLSLSMIVPQRYGMIACVSVLFIGFAAAECITTVYRVTPIGLNDVLLIPSIIRIFPIYFNVWQIIGIALLLIAAIGGAVMVFVKSKRYRVMWKKALCVILVTALVIPAMFFAGFAADLLSREFPNLGEAYREYGFNYCFLISAVDRGVERGEDYSEEKIASILSRIIKTGKPDAEERPNIVFVQLESFFNVDALENFTFSRDPIDDFNRLRTKYPGGKLIVPSIGAGTVNTEFEVLTGMKLSNFGAGEYPYKTVLRKYTCESAAYNLRELGYSTHALHNYEGTFYDRNEVYPMLGFGSFTSMEYMENLEFNASGNWVKDKILTNEILSLLRSTDGPDFVFAISDQAHGKYPPSSLPDDYAPEISVTLNENVRDDDDINLDAYVYYINQIAEVDDFVAELADAVLALDEKTVLVLYGDHLPGMYINQDDLRDSTLFETEYMIIRNYADDAGVDFGDLEAYRLSANVFSLIGFSNGILTKLHQNFYGTEQYSDWLGELEYDMLGDRGGRYVYGGDTEHYPVIEDMRMGTNEITVSGYVIRDGVLHVYGQHFTAFSKIKVDDSVLHDTEFVSSGELTVEFSDRHRAERLSVAQVSSDRTVLSESGSVEIAQ